MKLYFVVLTNLLLPLSHHGTAAFIVTTQKSNLHIFETRTTTSSLSLLKDPINAIASSANDNIKLPSNHAIENHIFFHQKSQLPSTTPSDWKNKNEFFPKQLTPRILSLCLATLLLLPTPTPAANYASLSPEQKSVAEAWRVIDNAYYDRTFNGQDWFKMREDAVKRKYKSMDEVQDQIATMMSQLGDKYTRYLSPDKYQSIVNSATGTLAGVGVEISTDKSGNVVVSDVEENSPASTGGIKKGDVFVEVDGTTIVPGSTPPDAVAGLLRGPEGSKVGVVTRRDGETKDFIVTRAKITVASVKSYLSTKDGVGKVGVIRIKSFSGTTARLVSEKINDLKGRGAAAFVIDVRRNPGGLLPGGVDTASLFLEENKPIVFTVNKSGTVDSQYTLTTGVELDSPLVVFVDGNTASASEVLTAALKENKRAVIVGEKTFGKGVVQTIRELSNGNGGLAVTIARYETPNHNDINKQGIAVDIPIADCTNDDAVTCIPQSAFKKVN